MDPILFDPVKALGSIAGIVALTIALVHVIKRQLGDTPYLNQVPTIVYALAICTTLTYLSHAVYHQIEGEFSLLIFQSVIGTIVAAGAIEIVRNGAKPIADTRVAREARLRRSDRDEVAGDDPGDGFR